MPLDGGVVSTTPTWLHGQQLAVDDPRRAELVDEHAPLLGPENGKLLWVRFEA